MELFCFVLYCKTASALANSIAVPQHIRFFKNPTLVLVENTEYVSRKCGQQTSDHRHKAAFLCWEEERSVVGTFSGSWIRSTVLSCLVLSQPTLRCSLSACE